MDKLNSSDIEFIKMIMKLKEKNICNYYRILGMMDGILIMRNYYDNKDLNEHNEEV